MKIKHILLSLLLAMATLCTHAQAPATDRRQPATSLDKATIDTGTIYALIVGISRYDDKNIPQLHYADSDAVYFERIMRAGALGRVDSSNIHKLYNEDVTEAYFRRETSAITRRLKAGDKVYIFMAGHGDAANPEQVYFLAYTTPRVQDVETYQETQSIRMAEVIGDIKEMAVKKKSKIFLITDFCRSNELLGKDSLANFLFANVMGEDIPGLTRMVSCSSNHVSTEDDPAHLKWRGHGVFSYYLINGLLGMADKDKTGVVTLDDLATYVKEMVRQDTRSASNPKLYQVPEFKGDLQQTVAHVRAGAVQALLSVPLSVEMTDHGAAISELYHPTGRGGIYDHIEDTVLYSSFLSAISDKRLIAPADDDAVFYLTKLLAHITDENTQADLTDMLVASLLNEGQKPIDYYSRFLLDSLQFSEEYYNDAADYLAAALPYLAHNKELYDRINASRLFLQATGLDMSTSRDQWRRGLIVADSALAIARWSYTLSTKGALYCNLGQYDSSLYCYRRAAAIGGRSQLPYTSIGWVYLYLKKIDSAQIYFDKAIAIDPHNVFIYMCIAACYTSQPDHIKEYMYKAMRANPDNKIVYYYNGLLFQNYLYNSDSAISYYQKAISIDTAYSDAYQQLGSIFASDKKDNDSAFFYMHKAIAFDPKNELRYAAMGNFFINYTYKNDSVLYYYRQALRLKPTAGYIYNNIAIVLADDSAQRDSAILYYHRCIDIAPRQLYVYANLAAVYRDMNKNDSADFYFHKGIEVNPDNAAAYNSMGYFMCNTLSKTDSAIFYYRKGFEMDTTQDISYQRIGDLYKSQEHYDSAVFYYRKALYINPVNYSASSDIQKVFSDHLNQPDSAHLYNVIYCRESLKRKPTDAGTIRDLANAFSDYLQYDSAIYYYKKNIRLDPTSSHYSTLARFYRSIKQLDSAIYYYHQAITVNPYSDFSYDGLRDIYRYNLHQNDSANFYSLLYYRNTRRDKYGDEAWTKYYATAFKKIGQTDSALYYFRLNTTLHPTSSDCYVGYGDMQASVSDVMGAAESYRQAISIDPALRDVYPRLIRLYEEMRDTDSATLMQQRLDALGTK